MFDRFDQDALRAILASQVAARALNDATIGTGHLLAGLVSEEWFRATQVLTSLGLPSDDVRRALGLPEPTGDRRPMGRHVPFDPSMKKAMMQAGKEANGLKSDQVGTEHLLLALLRVGKGNGARLLSESGISYSSVLSTAKEMAPG